MNSVFKFLAFSIIMLLCTACPSPETHTDYLLINRTSDDLHITTYSSWFTEPDSIEINESFVAAGFDLYMYRNRGQSNGCLDDVSTNLNYLSERFDSIIITSPLGILTNSTVFDTTRWEFSSETDYDCYVDLKLELTDEDFQ